MAKYYLGLDIGANKIGAGLVKKEKILNYKKFPTQSKSSNKNILNNIIKAAKTVIAKQKIKGIGVGIAGQVDFDHGLFISGPNFSKKFKNIELEKILKKEFKTKVKIDNDANCFTMAEAAYGKGKPYRQIVGITLGTGIGGGIVVDGAIFRGANGLAGEFGHVYFGEQTFENMAAGKAMENLYKKTTGQKKNTFEIEALAKKGDKKALKVFETMTDSLAKGIAGIIQGLDPEIVVLGGGLIRVPLLTKPALQKVKNYLSYDALKKTMIVKSALGDKANVLGATILLQ